MPRGLTGGEKEAYIGEFAGKKIEEFRESTTLDEDFEDQLFDLIIDSIEFGEKLEALMEEKLKVK